ncbi:hypothetical protein [Nocardia sp. NPDC004722]
MDETRRSKMNETTVRKSINRALDRCTEFARSVLDATLLHRERIAQVVTGICYAAGFVAAILDFFGHPEIAKAIRIAAGIAAVVVSPYTPIVIGKALAYLRAAGQAVHRGVRAAGHAVRLGVRAAAGLGVRLARTLRTGWRRFSRWARRR